MAVNGKQRANRPDLFDEGLIGMVQAARLMAAPGMLKEDFRFLRNPGPEDPGSGQGKNRLPPLKIPLGLESPRGPERGQQEGADKVRGAWGLSQEIAWDIAVLKFEKAEA